MSRSVIIPTSFSSSVIGSEPMSCSRISRAASTTDADWPIERGSSVIASRTFFAIVPPLLFMCILALLLSDRERGGGAGRSVERVLRRTGFSTRSPLDPHVGRHEERRQAVLVALRL